MKWIKESGVEIETNELDATLKYCLSLGWKAVESDEVAEVADEVVEVTEKKKAGRPKKVVDTAKVLEGDLDNKEE